MQVWVALEQEIFWGLSGPGPKRLLAPSLVDFRGKTGIRALYQAIGISKLALVKRWRNEKPSDVGGGGRIGSLFMCASTIGPAKLVSQAAAATVSSCNCRVASGFKAEPPCTSHSQCASKPCKRTLRAVLHGVPFTGVQSLRQKRLIFRSQKINANFFCTNFFDNPSGRGRPRRKSWTSAPKSAFSCGPGGGEKLFDPWASGRKGQECPREIRTKKFMFMLFFFPEIRISRILLTDYPRRAQSSLSSVIHPAQRTLP